MIELRLDPLSTRCSLRGVREISVKAVKRLEALAKLTWLDERRLIVQLHDETLQSICQMLGAPFLGQYMISWLFSYRLHRFARSRSRIVRRYPDLLLSPVSP